MIVRPIKAFEPNWIFIAIAFAFSILTLVKINWYMPRSYDIWLWDETWYLFNGISDGHNLFYFGDPYETATLYSYFYRFENAPLYSAFYTSVHNFWSDATSTYLYGGNIIIILSIAMAFFAFLAVSNSLVFSLACVGILTISNAASIWPRVSLAAIALISITVIATRLSKTIFSATSIMMVGAFLAAFIRPEFVLSLYIFMILNAFFAVHKAITFRSASLSSADLPALISIAALFGLAVAWSFPILHLSAKGFSAFGQHFAVRVVAKQGLDINPWVNWRRITEQSFPGANSVVSAFIINPRAVAAFLIDNAVGTAEAAISTYIMPITPWHGLSRIVVLAFYAAVTYQVLRACTYKTSQIRHFSGIDKMMVCAILIFMAPVAISCIIVYPRSHYLVMLAFLVLMLICTLVGHLTLEERPFTVVVASCVLFWFTPALYSINQPNLEIIRKLRDLPGISTMVEIDGGWCTYLSPQCKTIFAYDLDKVVDVKSYFDERRVDAIFVSEGLLRYTPVSGNPQFANIIEDPTASSWTVRTLNNESYLLIREAK
jgi:hypothetical protein